MKKNINRRAFVGKTGALLSGFTMAQGVFYRKDKTGYVKADPASPLTTPVNTEPVGEAENSIGAGWWEKEPLRIIEFEDGYDFSEKFSLLRDLGANMEHATRFTDTSPGTSFLDAHNLFSGKKVNYSSLREYLDEAHKKNIRVVIYYNVHAIEINYARKHPEWQQIKDDGKPIEDVYSVDSSFCINSPWRLEVFNTLEKLATFGIDGIFYDGPIFFSSTCHCETCKSLFRERYGKEMPSKTDSSSRHDKPEWKEIVDFQSDSIARFLRESNKILKDKNPQILFYMNGNTLAPSWPTGRDNRKIIGETDILGAEGGFLYGELKEPVYKPGAMAKLLETQAGGKPTVVFDAAKQGPWSFSSLPQGEISILYSQTITSQANVWLAISAVANLHDKEVSTIRKYNQFIRDNPEPFFKARSLARIALVWPQASGNYYSGSAVPLTDFTKEMKPEKAGNTEEEFYGFYDGLSRCHFPFDVLDEAALTNDLQKYELIILPNTTCLKKEEADNIRKYVSAGGNIISTFETSAYDETGNKLPNFQLSDLFGTLSSGEVFGPLDWDYVAPASKDHFSLKGIKNEFLTAPTYGLKLKSSSPSPLFFCKPLPGSYSGSPEATDMPFITDTTYGKGRSVYISGTFGSSLHKFHFPEYYHMLENIVNELTSQLVGLENAPSSVEVSIRKKGNSVYLYLINFTSEMKRPVEKIIPCPDIKINLSLNEKVRDVTALWQESRMKFTARDGMISMALPYLGDYEVLKIDI